MEHLFLIILRYLNSFIFHFQESLNILLMGNFKGTVSLATIILVEVVWCLIEGWLFSRMESLVPLVQSLKKRMEVPDYEMVNILC